MRASLHTCTKYRGDFGILTRQQIRCRTAGRACSQRRQISAFQRGKWLPRRRIKQQNQRVNQRQIAFAIAIVDGNDFDGERF